MYLSLKRSRRKSLDPFKKEKDKNNETLTERKGFSYVYSQAFHHRSKNIAHVHTIFFSEELLDNWGRGVNLSESTFSDLRQIFIWVMFKTVLLQSFRDYLHKINFIYITLYNFFVNFEINTYLARYMMRSKS